MKFNIPMTAMAVVSTCMEVEADSLEQAQQKALQSAKEGNAVWQYQGADDSSIELGE